MTSTHPVTNPRLVKEADALVDAGYRVRLVATRNAAWAADVEHEFTARPWWDGIAWARIGPFARWPERQAMRLRRRLLRASVGRRPGLVPALDALALHDAPAQLARLAAEQPADLYIAHNLAALPAAARAARRHRAKLGFDAEDFHRGELTPTARNRVVIDLTRALEEAYIPACDYLTAASEGIAEAYAEALSIPRPTTVLNTFPLSERDAPIPAEDLEHERRGDALSLYWFSQTIGPDRGLGDALVVMARLGPGVRLHLRGTWVSGYEAQFMAAARALGVAERVHHLPVVPPFELIARTARHDVGLALETGETPNRKIATTNKILAYLVAGLAVAATDTRGQRAVMDAAPGAGLTYRPGDVDTLAAWLTDLRRSPDRLARARQAARAAAEARFCWERQKTGFTDLIARVLEAPARSRQAW
ncbi:MAG: hypothetical protein R3349_07190 [Geminicoccaceae bacterium]|nr:hypothetical protein [Geminicoccaceae bacterium]